MEQARWANPSDRAEVEALAGEAAAGLRDQRGGPMWLEREISGVADPEILAAALAGVGQRRAVVGLLDDVVVGFALVSADEFGQEGRLWVVSDLFVTAAARGVGVGEAMMDLIIEGARADGAVGIDSVALPGDRATKNFFERFGLTARAIVVHRALPPNRPEPTSEPGE